MKTLLKQPILLAVLVFFLNSCGDSNPHFLKDEAYRTKVHQQFLERTKLAENRSKELFSVLDREDLTLEQKEALEFLFAYMPLSDLADYDGEYFLRQVDGAFAARDYFDWGKKIPEEVFRHFVLVYRVNNEDLDDARSAFFDELKDRVKGMSMEDAALEVNHWCHEKVTYRSTDGRTSAPLALAKTSWGRCGEESTFAVAALRSVGIPARQCYTPRWVHTDDNHAWVEVWVDGTWHYIGACEPMPELDVAWFTAPAKRAMMVHTNVFGLYDGPEEKNVEKDLYTVINLLNNYTETRNVNIKVVDEKDDAVEGADVRFEVYNYAEFYPMATVKTKAEGTASIMSGYGDIFVHVSKGDKYGYAKSSASENNLTIVLDKKPGKTYEETFVMSVPKEQAIKDISEEKIAENAVRLAYEDSIRNAHMATFIKEDIAREFATSNSLDADKAWAILEKSQGNWAEILKVLSTKKEYPLVFDVFEAVSAKDLRDTPAEYLMDHMFADQKTMNGTPKEMFGEYINSPRIGRELIRPWRTYFKEHLSKDLIEKVNSNPEVLVDYVRESIKITNTENYYNCPLSPRGVYEMKLADKRSRDVLFVALCRTLGIASRLEPSTSRPQYFYNKQWKDVMFEAKATELPKGSVLFTGNKDNIVKPAYSRHYSIARFENGIFRTLDFESDASLRNLPSQVQVDAGYYRMIIGSRANDGSVTVNARYFEVEEKKTVSQEVKLPKVEGRIQVQGIVDPNTIVNLDNGEEKTLKELMNGVGLMICFADPDKEPTKHILQDLPAVQTELETWNGGILFAVPNDKLSKAFDASVFKGLPKQSVWMVDNNRALLNAAAGALQLDFTNNFPLTIYLNTNGGILFSSQGYRIGIGENILKTIKAEEQTKK